MFRGMWVVSVCTFRFVCSKCVLPHDRRKEREREVDTNAKLPAGEVAAGCQLGSEFKQNVHWQRERKVERGGERWGEVERDGLQRSLWLSAGRVPPRCWYWMDFRGHSSTFVLAYLTFDGNISAVCCLIFSCVEITGWMCQFLLNIIGKNRRQWLVNCIQRRTLQGHSIEISEEARSSGDELCWCT